MLQNICTAADPMRTFTILRMRAIALCAHNAAQRRVYDHTVSGSTLYWHMAYGRQTVMMALSQEYDVSDEAAELFLTYLATQHDA